MMTFVALLLVFTAYICYALYKRHKLMNLLHNNGIPGPKPNIILGNIQEYFKLPLIQREKEWIEKYGKIVGYYMGANPTVLVADPNLAKRIQIADFNIFPDKNEMIKNGLTADPHAKHMLSTLRGRRWREVRTALTPAFSGSKLKAMTPIIDNAIDEFMSTMEERSKSGNEFDISRIFQKLTNDVIGRTAFGIRTNVQSVENQKFLIAANTITNQLPNFCLVLIIQCFPVLDQLLYPIRRFREIFLQLREQSPKKIIYNMVEEAIKLRKHSVENRQLDLLQILLNMTTGNGNESFFTVSEIKGNSMFFYLAGFETTSTTLGYVAHILVNYPDIQEKVRREAQQLLESEGKLDFNVDKGLHFMDCVLNETMRLYTPVYQYRRVCLMDYKYGDITIPKGAHIRLAVHHMQHSPDYWPEPELFDPMRFSAYRKHTIQPNTWQPFGSGPRNCIGMRFALFEIKLVLAKLLINYRLIPGTNTEIGKLSTTPNFFIVRPTNGVYVKVVKI